MKKVCKKLLATTATFSTEYPVKRRAQEPQDQEIADAPHPNILTLMRQGKRPSAPSRDSFPPTP